MNTQKLEVGDILAAKYTYGGECLHWKFFKVLKVTDSTVTIVAIKSETLYDDGKKGPHYYDAPRYQYPLFDRDGKYAVDDEAPIRRKIKYSSSGLPIVKIDYWYTARGTWNGKPLESYNYH